MRFEFSSVFASYHYRKSFLCLYGISDRPQEKCFRKALAKRLWRLARHEITACFCAQKNRALYESTLILHHAGKHLEIKTTALSESELLKLVLKQLDELGNGLSPQLFRRDPLPRDCEKCRIHQTHVQIGPLLTRH